MAAVGGEQLQDVIASGTCHHGHPIAEWLYLALDGGHSVTVECPQYPRLCRIRHQQVGTFRHRQTVVTGRNEPMCHLCVGCKTACHERKEKEKLVHQSVIAFLYNI